MVINHGCSEMSLFRTIPFRMVLELGIIEDILYFGRVTENRQHSLIMQPNTLTLFKIAETY